MTEHPPSNEDSKLFEALDSYVEQLHRGDRPDRQNLDRLYPGLGSVLDCLEVLDSIAPPSDASLSIEAHILEDARQDAEGARASVTVSADSAASFLQLDFGEYALEHELGRGGMGVVFKARQKSLDRVVAVKMILASHLASPDQIRRFHLESKAAAAVRHQHIVNIFEAGQVHGQHYFAMEFIDGESLAERIAHGPMDCETAARLMVSVARAVDHLHGHGIVHRDLKPSNILLDAEGQPHVNDFGLAKLLAGAEALTHSGVIAGTPSYMAPEQAAAKADEVGPRSDVYSLGAILYELLTGKPPFHASNPLDTLVQVLEREPLLPRQLNARIPRPLELIVLKCLEKSPTGRYASASELADDLERYLTGEPVECHARSRVQRLWRWARREPALASRLAVMLCFYVVQLANYHIFHVIDWNFHWKVSAILLGWVLSSVLFQQLMNHETWSELARYLWATVDALAVVLLLSLADGAASPLIVVYPLLVVGSGLWFRVRLVWFVTALSVIAYLILVADFYVNRSDLHSHFDTAYDRPVFFIVMLIALGGSVAYQVQRVRALSRYYEKRRLP